MCQKFLVLCTQRTTVQILYLQHLSKWRTNLQKLSWCYWMDHENKEIINISITLARWYFRNLNLSPQRFFNFLHFFFSKGFNKILVLKWDTKVWKNYICVDVTSDFIRHWRFPKFSFWIWREISKNFYCTGGCCWIVGFFLPNIPNPISPPSMEKIG